MATPKFEPAFQVNGLPYVTFEYPRKIAVAVGYHFGLVRASRHGGEDHYEAVFELYENDPGDCHDPSTVPWNAKLYIWIYGSLDDPTFKVKVEPLGTRLF